MLNQLHSLLSWSHDYTGALHRAHWPARLGVWNITCLLVDTVTLCRVLLSPVELWWCPSLTSFLLTWCWCRPASMLWKDILRHWGATKSQPSVRFSQSILHQHSDISHIDIVFDLFVCLRSWTMCTWLVFISGLLEVHLILILTFSYLNYLLVVKMDQKSLVPVCRVY